VQRPATRDDREREHKIHSHNAGKLGEIRLALVVFVRRIQVLRDPFERIRPRDVAQRKVEGEGRDVVGEWEKVRQAVRWGRQFVVIYISNGNVFVPFDIQGLHIFVHALSDFRQWANLAWTTDFSFPCI
jgi:hypothetical protein